MIIWTGIEVDRQLQALKESAAETEKKLAPAHSIRTLPFHISLKMSFPAAPEQVEAITQALRDYYSGIEAFEIPVSRIEYYGTILWVRMAGCPGLERMKDEINAMLKDRFGIGMHEYDSDYIFHTTLFMDDEAEKVYRAWEMMNDKPLPEKLRTESFLIGYSETGEPGSFRVVSRQPV
ncbi:MAG: 2'-5' RNA ligase family protein [Lachnospiraceae bacterium]|nr:2'-5' RNA ligase family protein [Lachnospiraceae bacterium]